MYEEREVVMVKYELDEAEVNVYIWDYKGIPLKYETREDGELTRKIEFLNLVINGVKDSDVTKD